MNWNGDNPLYMVLQTLTDILVIDLDEPGWKDTYGEELKQPGMRSLVTKDTDEIVLQRFCSADEVVTYNSKIVGFFGGPQVRAYGFIVITSSTRDEVYWLPWSNKVVNKDELYAIASERLASVGRGPSDIVVPDE